MMATTTALRIPTLEEATVLTAGDKAFLRAVAKKIRAVEPETRLLLYGSRGRGEAREDSDWDILAIHEREDVRQIRGEFRKAIEGSSVHRSADVELMYSPLERWRTHHSWLEYFRNVLDDAIEL